MGGTLVDTIFVLIAAKPWLLTAACDFVTAVCMVGIAVLVLDRRPRPSAAVTPVEPAVSAPAQPELRSAVRLRRADPGHTTVLPADLPGTRRRAVDDAMAAMERWETTYRGTGRGLDDLTRLARKRQQGVTQESVKAPR